MVYFTFFSETCLKSLTAPINSPQNILPPQKNVSPQESIKISTGIKLELSGLIENRGNIEISGVLNRAYEREIFKRY